ncbi:LacI family DNA-binding transcriptional regulator [Streptomyces sulphureus]|uniref:LacI family DNA-binding transcriptional regulator n=1 Tax=Streptomyces sulphureus TaxID=47758 RepID=UPI000365BE6A|nr:LacI family DNA-binding transcriptional regulator [Streptomyces sulphureus]
MADVAERAGVSRALVSIVFRGQPGAGEETRERILRVADEVGYHPDNAARLLARGRSRALGVLFTVQHPFHADLVSRIYPEAEELGYDALLSSPAHGRTEQKAVEALLSHRCEAVLLLGPEAPQAYLNELGRRTVVVSVSRRAAGAPVDSVYTAESSGVRQAMNHLFDLGHRSLVHVDGGKGPGSTERRRAYRASMRRRGLSEELRVIPGGGTEESGVEAGELLLRERDLGAELPTAVLAANDRCAMGLMLALTRGGVDVPRDLSVVGYDDSHRSHMMPIGLTTVRQDVDVMAERAVRFAVERLENAELEPRHAVLGAKLMVRGTTGPPRAEAR